MDSRRHIEELASAWIARRDAGEWTAADEAELGRWLDESTANRVTFLRLEAGWTAANRLRALGAGVKPGAVPGRWALRASPYFFRGSAGAEKPSQSKQRRRTLTIAAALATAIVASVVWHSGGFDRTHYSTPVGGLAFVPMSDGSKVTLNTDSEIRLAVTSQQRVVNLEQGEAFFEVAKDAARPFIVNAGSKRIVAIGTAFAVRRAGDTVQVTVTEGEVRVETSSVSGAGKPVAKLTAGQVAKAGSAGIRVEERQVVAVNELLSWRSGLVVFRATPLLEAAAEFNRYNTRKIVVEDPAVAGIRVGGSFRATNVEAFARLLEEGFPVRVVQDGDRIAVMAPLKK